MGVQHNEVVRDAILKEVESAFADVQLGCGRSLHQARHLDDCWVDDPAQRKQDPELSWTELGDEKMRAFSDVFNFLDAEGFRFYLPAFIGWILRDAAGGLDESFMFSLCGCSARDGSWRAPILIAEVLLLLTPNQKHALCRFLNYQARNDSGWSREAIVACDRFWDAECGR